MRGSGGGGGAGRTLLYVALFRIFVGFLLLSSGWSKLSWLGSAAPFRAMVGRWLSAHPYGWYEQFLTAIVLPNAGTFATIIVFTELLVGVTLLIGFLTRLSAAVMLLLFSVYWLGGGHTGTNADLLHKLMVGTALLFIATGAGRAAGIDALLARQRPRGPLW